MPKPKSSTEKDNFAVLETKTQKKCQGVMTL